jgi:transcriptional regulator with XRE-family HTH domain
VDRYAIGARIRWLRRQRGLTQKELGGLLGYSRSAIAMIESGERHDVEKLGVLVALCQALRVSLQELLLDPVPGVAANSASVRELTAAFGPGAAAIADAVETQQVNADAIAAYRGILDALHHAEDRVGSHPGLLRASEAHVATLRGWLAAGSPATLERPLGLLLAEYGQFSGWMAYDQQQRDRAAKLYADALDVVDGLGDDPLAAYLTGNLASIEMGEEHPGTIARAAAGPNPEALARAGHAEDLAGGLRSGRAQALILTDAAWVFGMAGAQHRKHVVELLDLASTRLDDEEDDRAPPWAYWFDQGMLERRQARSLVQVGHHLEAQAALRRVIAVTDPGLVRDQVTTRAYLIDSLLSSGDLDEAAWILCEAARLLTGTSSRRIERRLFGLYERLRRRVRTRDGTGVLADLAEQLRALRHNP